MNRLLALALVLYVPHLAEEALTHMHDDPLIVAAFTPFAQLSARHSAYLVFQVMLVLTLSTTLLFSLGGRAQVLVLGVVAVALVAGGHHLVRAGLSVAANSGLLTSLPMPVVGAYLLRRVVVAWRAGAALRREGTGRAAGLSSAMALTAGPGWLAVFSQLD